ncbi:hypothetical protein JOC34_000479 [Virgibacillus halotolerans]|uniref:hypothetical protein n=1 Tax=Virgibacillus halotolerans TaxID=1071053 RepID=UPI00195F3D19|nr:hypothetical protein [Virgibacillus halotolerans]MBM7598122.1 hypothetical protein [Virgibacillus halotolerans]
MTTIIHLSKNIQELPKQIINWEITPEEVKEFIISNGTDYRVFSSQELIIYNGMKMIASCTIGGIADMEDDTRFDIENCWTEQGNIWI